MLTHEYEGKKIDLERNGEFVKGILVGSEYGPQYNARWKNSDGQGWIGLVEEDEMKQFRIKIEE